MCFSCDSVPCCWCNLGLVLVQAVGFVSQGLDIVGSGDEKSFIRIVKMEVEVEEIFARERQGSDGNRGSPSAPSIVASEDILPLLLLLLFGPVLRLMRVGQILLEY